jgi:hypothetical protein
MHNRYLQMRASEPFVLPHPQEFVLRDSATAKTVPVLALSRNLESSNSVDMYTAELDTVVYHLSISEISDSSGNVMDTLTVLSFRGTEKTDTTHFKIVSSGPSDSSANHQPEDPVFIEFSTPVNWDSISRRFSLETQGGLPVPGNWLIRSAFDAEFYPDNAFSPDSSYQVLLDVENTFDIWQNQLEDSLFSRYFTVVSERELGEIAGKVSAPGFPTENVNLTIRSIRQRNFMRKMVLQREGPYKKNYLPEGDYLLNCYIDLDENGTYSAGSLFPFRYSEPFVFHPDTIKVRKRWETSGVHISLPQAGKTK